MFPSTYEYYYMCTGSTQDVYFLLSQNKCSSANKNALLYYSDILVIIFNMFDREMYIDLVLAPAVPFVGRR